MAMAGRVTAQPRRGGNVRGRRGALQLSRRAGAPRAVAVEAGVRTVGETKSAFLDLYPKPLGYIYSTAINELLVQQHLLQVNTQYKYNAIHGLGLVSLFDQFLSDEPDKDIIFEAYVKALCEDPEVYRSDGKALEAAAVATKGGSLDPDAGGNDLQKKFAEVAAMGSKLHTKFSAIGLFRILESAGSMEPKILEELCGKLGMSYEKVNKDLTMYKGMLSKIEGAKELAGETAKREKRKDEERLAEKQEREAKKKTETIQAPSSPPQEA